MYLINIDILKNSNSALIIEFDVKLKFIAVTLEGGRERSLSKFGEPMGREACFLKDS
jgi:hypothetical protein